MTATRKIKEKESFAESVLDRRRFLELGGTGLLAGLAVLFGAVGCGESAGDGVVNGGGEGGGGNGGEDNENGDGNGGGRNNNGDGGDGDDGNENGGGNDNDE